MKMILIGFMGSGKTTIAKEISHQLSIEQHDLDLMIEQAAGTSIPNYFDQYGENEFRALEHRTLINALLLDGILSTGGGTPMFENNFALIKSHPTITVFLNASDKTINQHLVQDNIQTRPLFHKLGMNGIIKLKHARQKTYENLADQIIDVNDKDPKTIANEIIQQIQIK